MGKAPEKHDKRLDNLRHDFTPEERAANGKKGGIASGESKRRTKSFSEAMRVILDMECGEEQSAALEALGLDPTWRNLISLANIKKASGGDTAATALVRDTVGEKPRDGLEIGNLDDKPLSTLDMSKLSDGQLREILARRSANPADGET